MRRLIFIFLLIMSGTLSAQSPNVKLSFVPTFGEKPLTLATPLGKDAIEVETFKCYISQIELYDGHTLVYAEDNSFHLLDVADVNSLSWHLLIPEQLVYSTIRFNIGIDSLMHVSGAFGGDLDPMHGMYWTWQSGYINLKIEGTSSGCPARNHQFQLHLGGYQQTFNSLQQLRLTIDNTGEIKIAIAIDDFLAALDLKENYQIMSPGKQAVAAARLFAAVFRAI